MAPLSPCAPPPWPPARRPASPTTHRHCRQRRPRPQGAAPTGHPATRSSATTGAYDPAYLESAYDTPSATGGSGQTVAIVDAYDDPSVATDLSAYRTLRSPACTTANGCFRKVNEHGGTTYPAGNTGWGQEISLDLDMVSAICPNCHILLVEANSASIPDLGTAVERGGDARGQCGQQQLRGPEYSTETDRQRQVLRPPRVAVTVAAGDDGYGPEFPATSNT